jgi:hypothetical protein
MSETVLERHYRDRVQSVRQMALPEAARAALTWRDFEDLMALCSELSVSGRELLRKEHRRVFVEPNLTVTWLRERRRVIEELSGNYAQVAQAVRDSAFRAWQAAGSPPGADFGSLDDAIAAVTRAKQELLANWLVGTDEEMAEAHASASRGEGLDLEEAFAQIAGVSVAEWRQRIDEHKRGPKE